MDSFSCDVFKIYLSNLISTFFSLCIYFHYNFEKYISKLWLIYSNFFFFISLDKNKEYQKINMNLLNMENGK